MTFCLVVMTTARVGEEERVAKGYAALEAASRTEPAVLEWRVHRLLDDPRRFLLYELYTDTTGLDAHRKTEHFKSYERDVVPLLERREFEAWGALSD